MGKQSKLPTYADVSDIEDAMRRGFRGEMADLWPTSLVLKSRLQRLQRMENLVLWTSDVILECGDLDAPKKGGTDGVDFALKSLRQMKAEHEQMRDAAGAGRDHELLNGVDHAILILETVKGAMPAEKGAT